MEALTAIGLIANIIQFVDLGAKLVGSAKEMRDSASGMTVENKSLEEVTIEMRDLTLRLEAPKTRASSQDERALRLLAQECRELSDQILRLLKKIAPSKPNSTLRSIRSAIRTIKYKDEMRELEEKLAKCRSQLHLHLSRLTNLEVKAQLQALGRLESSNEDMWRVFDQQMEQVRRGTCVASLSVEAQDQIKTLLGLSRLTIEGNAARAILHLLAFDEMRTRAETIQEEHCDTFRWIVDPSAKVDNTTLASNARELYLSWLSRGRGIFHVAGKLGSGKSTLMKFLFDHPETRKQLLEWAGDAKLVMTNHFFWKPGKQPLQKSFNGMMRSLLFDILGAHPDLIKIAFPSDWAVLVTEDRLTLFQSPMPLQKTLDALLALLKNEAVQRSYRFCFFIDALDEFEDTPQHDDKYMVDALRSWVQTAPNVIKLCVSSREHNVFVNAFADGPRIRLQELTRHDMECFTQSKLGSIHEAAIRERLTHDIVDRSDGIFLWVVLVIKQLRQALEDGRDTSSFEEELATLPSELEELFEHLLRSIQKSQRKKAYQIFAMVQEHETLPHRLSLLSCLHIDAYQAYGQLAMKEPSTSPKLSTQDGFDPHIWYESQIKKARILLQGYCKGLVEDRPAPEVHKVDDILHDGRTKDWDRRDWPKDHETFPNTSKPAGSRCILFVHRTIVEFLERPAVLETTTIQLAGFDVIEAISQLHLAEYEATPCSLIDPLYWSYLYGNLMDLRFHAGKDRSHFEFLVKLEAAISEKFPGWLENKLPPSREYVLDIYHKNFVLKAQGTNGSFESWKDHVRIPLTTPVSISAWLGNAAYIVWRITRSHEPPLSDQLAGIVLHCLVHSLSKIERTEDLKTIVICFELLLNDNASPSAHFLWPRLLIDCACSTRHSEPSWSRAIGQLIVLFLKRYKEKGVHTTEVSVSSNMVMGETQTCWSVSVQGDDVLVEYIVPEAGTAGDILNNRSRGMGSLEKLVKLWNLENEAEVLGLIEQAHLATARYEQAADLVATAQAGAEESLSDDNLASGTTSGSLQRIDSAAEIRSESGVKSSCLPVETKADISQPHSGRAFGVMAVIALLVLLSAVLIAHQDYRGRWPSFMVY